ncbi:MAG: phosphoserine phosphatase SerB [Micrococcales bacterium]
MTNFLVIFDVDSTLIEDEVIELLAEVAGKRAEVAAVTERAMRGELDFAESLRERVKTLKDLPESVFEDVFARITPTIGVSELIKQIHAKGGKAAAVSGGFTKVLTPLAKQLNLDFYRANDLEIVDSKLTGKVEGKIIDKAAKAEALKEWASELKLPLEKTMAVGDGANDLEMMAIAKIGVAFNAKPIVREKADVVIENHDLRDLIPYLDQL